MADLVFNKAINKWSCDQAHGNQEETLKSAKSLKEKTFQRLHQPLFSP